MLRIGCHLSSSKGYCAMAKDALKIHANTFQYFSRNPRGGNAKALDQDDISRFLLQAKANDIHPFLAHAPYTLNGCSADPTLRDFAKRTMADDLARLESTPGNLYNFHPGSHVKQGTDVGISYIADIHTYAQHSRSPPAVSRSRNPRRYRAWSHAPGYGSRAYTSLYCYK